MQYKGTLHFHAILYLTGFPRTCEDIGKYRSSDEFESKLMKYFDTICSTSIPFDEEIESCAIYNYKDLQNAKMINDEAYQIKKAIVHQKQFIERRV